MKKWYGMIVGLVLLGLLLIACAPPGYGPSGDTSWSSYDGWEWVADSLRRKIDCETQVICYQTKAPATVPTRPDCVPMTEQQYQKLCGQ